MIGIQLDAAAVSKELANLRGAVATPPDVDSIVPRVSEMARLLERVLAAGELEREAMESSATAPAWVGQRLGEQVVFVGPDLFLRAENDGSMCTLVSNEINWELTKAGPDLRVVVVCDKAHHDWTITESGVLIDNLAPTWRPTHVVADRPLPVGGVPFGTLTPGTVLDPRLEVKVIEAKDD